MAKGRAAPREARAGQALEAADDEEESGSAEAPQGGGKMPRGTRQTAGFNI